MAGKLTMVFPFLKGGKHTKQHKRMTVGLSKRKYLHLALRIGSMRPWILTLGEWLRFTTTPAPPPSPAAGISVSAFSWYHCGPEFSTTGSSEGFNFAITSLGALRSPSWLRFNSSSCLYLSISLLFLALVPESQNISLVGILEITFLLSSAASFLRTCSQGSKTFSA